MGRPRSLTEGNIFSSLIRFAVPVLFTLFLQALYGGVDLLVVGQFAQTADVSGVATGSMLLQTVTMVVTGLSMGITILVGERIGRAKSADDRKYKTIYAEIGRDIERSLEALCEEARG